MAVPNIFGTATAAIPLSQLDTNFATPVTIGNTAVQLGNTVTSFGNVTLTNVTISSGNVTVSAGSNTAPSITTVGDTNTGIFFPAADTIAFSEGGAEAMRLDSAGNMGLGVTPSAWTAAYRAFDFGGYGNLYSNSTDKEVALTYNAAVVSGTGWTYKNTNQASLYNQQNGKHIWQTAASGTAGTSISWTTPMTLDASGRLGIGLTSPQTSLDVNGVITVRDGTLTGSGRVEISSTAFVGLTMASGSYVFKNASNTSEYARIDSSGNLLVGQTSAGVLGGSIGTSIEASGLNNARITINHSSGGSSNGSYFMQFAYGGVLSGGITQASTTTVGFYTGPSDRRLKNNIEDLDSSGEFIDALRPRKWTWIKSGEADSGFVADELQTVISCCVNGEADAVDEDGKPVYQMVDASPPEMIANIVAELKAIRKREKEQQAIITSLTDRITALEAK
jgi:hypothetical protein